MDALSRKSGMAAAARLGASAVSVRAGARELVREAGGTFTDLAGAAVGLGTTSVLASNGVLHESTLGALTR